MAKGSSPPLLLLVVDMERRLRWRWHGADVEEGRWTNAYDDDDGRRRERRRMERPTDRDGGIVASCAWWSWGWEWGLRPWAGESARRRRC
jgi:hypothetical protein